MKVAIYLAAKSDSGGNPQRGWLVVNQNGTALEFVDEGYDGDRILRQKYPGIYSTGRIDLRQGQYRELVRDLAK